jgi:chromosome segregation ATPase
MTDPNKKPATVLNDELRAQIEELRRQISEYNALLDPKKDPIGDAQGRLARISQEADEAEASLAELKKTHEMALAKIRKKSENLIRERDCIARAKEKIDSAFAGVDDLLG